MRFQSIVLAAVAALGSTVIAQSSALSSAESAGSSAVSSATSSVASSVRSSGSSSSSDASSTSSAASSSSASSSVTSSSDSSSITSSASSAAASSSSGSDDEEPTSTRVYTTTYYYLTENPTHKAVSPTLLIESVVKSTSGAINQQSFSTPTGSVTMLTVSKSTYTTTVTSTNRFHDAVSQYFTSTEIVTTTMGLPTDTSSSEGAAGKVSAREIGGVAAFFLGIAGMYL